MKFTLFLAAIASLAVAGCSHKTDTIVGTWIDVDTQSPGNDLTYVFRPDGTFSFVEHAAYQSVHSHQSAEGTYTIAGGTLTINTTREEMGIDAAAMAAIDAREKELNPNLHISSDTGDVPVKIEQPITEFLFTLDDDQLSLKNIANAADHGKTFERQ